jgi:hypothetical protein
LNKLFDAFKSDVSYLKVFLGIKGFSGFFISVLINSVMISEVICSISSFGKLRKKSCFVFGFVIFDSFLIGSILAFISNFSFLVIFIFFFGFSSFFISFGFSSSINNSSRSIISSLSFLSCFFFLGFMHSLKVVIDL